MEMISLLGMLGLISVDDIKTHKIRDLEVLAFAVIGMYYHLLFQRIGLLELLGGMAIGGVVYVLSLFTEEAIGKGDALVFMLTGCFLGLKYNILLVWVSTIALSLFGIVMMLLGKKKLNDHIPMVPFVLIAYLMILIINGGKIT